MDIMSQLCVAFLWYIGYRYVNPKRQSVEQKYKKTWSILDFHNKLKCRNMCGIKCQCCLWGLCVINVACEV